MFSVGTHPLLCLQIKLLLRGHQGNLLPNRQFSKVDEVEFKLSLISCVFIDEVRDNFTLLNDILESELHHFLLVFTQVLEPRLFCQVGLVPAIEEIICFVAYVYAFKLFEKLLVHAIMDMTCPFLSLHLHLLRIKLVWISPVFFDAIDF